jgi:hypothetical protein
MKVSAPNEGCRATVEGTEIFGLAVGTGEESYYTVLGWDRRRMLTVIDENTAVMLEWPDSDFFKVRVGSDPPFLLNDEQKSKNEKEGK